MRQSEDYEPLNLEAEGEDGTGPAIASVLDSAANALREVGENKRYDFSLTVEERDD